MNNLILIISTGFICDRLFKIEQVILKMLRPNKINILTRTIETQTEPVELEKRELINYFRNTN
jgi:hypothetical protein